MISEDRRLRKYFLATALGLSSLLFAACGSGDDDPAASATETPAPATATVAAARTATAVVAATATATVVGTNAAPTATGVIIVPTLSLGRELLLDGSFEAQQLSQHWEPRLASGQLIQLTTERQATGQNALYMTTPSGAATSPRVILRERFPAEAGSSYQVLFNAVQSMEAPVDLVVEFYDGSGAVIGRESVIEKVDSTDDWTEIVQMVVAPAGSATALLEVRIQIMPDSGVTQPATLEVWVDDVSVRKANEG